MLYSASSIHYSNIQLNGQCILLIVNWIQLEYSQCISFALLNSLILVDNLDHRCGTLSRSIRDSSEVWYIEKIDKIGNNLVTVIYGESKGQTRRNVHSKLRFTKYFNMSTKIAYIDYQPCSDGLGYQFLHFLRISRS